MSKIKLWENTHFGKIIAVYADGTEEEIGYINDDGERIYYADDTIAIPPRKFRSEWNQRQYDAYKKKQTDALNNNGSTPSFPDLIQKHSHNVVAGAGDLLAKVQQVQNTSIQNSGLTYRNPVTNILASGMNIDIQGKWMYMGDSVMYIDESSMFNNINLPNSRILDSGTKYSSKNSEVIELKDNGMYTITNLKTGQIQTFNGRYFQPPKPSLLSNFEVKIDNKMKVSEQGLEFIKSWEGFKEKMYDANPG